MNSKKCDRCGAYYLPKPTIFHVFRLVDRKIIFRNETQLDLCDDCCISLKDWLKQKEQSNETD